MWHRTQFPIVLGALLSVSCVTGGYLGPSGDRLSVNELLRLQRTLVNISDSKWAELRQAEMEFEQTNAARQIRVAFMFAAPGRSLADHELAHRYLTSALTRTPILPDSVADLIVTTRAWLSREIALQKEREQINSRVVNLNQQLDTMVGERNALDKSLQEVIDENASENQDEQDVKTDSAIAITELQLRLQNLTRQRDILIEALTRLRGDLAEKQQQLDALTEIEQSVIRPPKKEIP